MASCVRACRVGPATVAGSLTHCASIRSSVSIRTALAPVRPCRRRASRPLNASRWRGRHAYAEAVAGEGPDGVPESSVGPSDRHALQGELEDDAAHSLQDQWRQVGMAVGLAVMAGVCIWLAYGAQTAFQYASVYLVEQSLSADNLFVMYLVFERLKVPRHLRARVLTWGIGSAAVMRVLMIGAGGYGLTSVPWVSLLFAVVILQSGFSMLVPSEDEGEEEEAEGAALAAWFRRWLPITTDYDGDRFFTRKEGPLKATPLFLVLMVIEVTDVVFSWDNVAAVFSCSTNMALVWTATMFAIIGLRAWYSIIATIIGDMPALQTATGWILVYLGAKMVAEFLFPAVHVSTQYTLLVILASLAIGVAVSFWDRRKEKATVPSSEGKAPPDVSTA